MKKLGSVSRNRTARHPYFHPGHPDDHIPKFELPEAPSPPPPRWLLGTGFVLCMAVAVLGWLWAQLGQTTATPAVHPLWMLPFAALLGAIAIMPFVARHFWEKYYAAVSAGLGLLVVMYYHWGLHAGGCIARSMSDYISFIYLVGALFVISGGIMIRVRCTATPWVNTVLLLIGAILANVFGTTGAAMLLIRPYLRMNEAHMRPYHVVFFIAVVANVGGTLTPLGPPLFLGLLKGIPFWWVFAHCWPAWCVAVGLILAVFLVIDSRAHAGKQRERPEEHDLGPVVSMFGAANLVYLCLVLAAVFLPPPWREMLMTAAAFASLVTTPRRIHIENHFNFAPIKEVAFLFVGIFATMVPALNYLYSHAHDAQFRAALRTPGQYFYTTGGLSSVLDNGPTYLLFLESELGKVDPAVVIILRKVAADPRGVRPTAEDLRPLSAADQETLRGAVDTLARYRRQDERHGTFADAYIQGAILSGSPRMNLDLLAISLGAVFFGACTYIGNGPNFMVKSIAEHAGVRCPSFFGYIAYYTIPVLLPIFTLVWLLFLRR